MSSLFLTFLEGRYALIQSYVIFSKYLGGSMIELFEKNKSLADEMTTNMILYAGSRSSSSSPHFKASDVSAF